MRPASGTTKMLDRAEPTGLVCGYAIREAGRMEELHWRDMDAALADPTCAVWLHFNLADVRARAWIENVAAMPLAAKEILLGQDKHVRMELCSGAVAGVVGDLHRDFAQKSDQLDVLRFFLDERRLISCRRSPLAGVYKLRRAIDDGLRVERTIGLLADFFHHVTDTLGELLLELSGDVDDLEDGILSDDVSGQSPELARVRRVVIKLRRHLVPQQHTLRGLIGRMPAWVSVEDANELRGAIERLAALGHDLDLVQDRARLLADQLAARLMEANNRNLYVLSIVTTVFLPMTLVTGVFGMNLGGLPWQQDAHGFAIGMAIMLGLGLLAYFLLRRRRMF